LVQQNIIGANDFHLVTYGRD